MVVEGVRRSRAGGSFMLASALVSVVVLAILSPDLRRPWLLGPWEMTVAALIALVLVVMAVRARHVPLVLDHAEFSLETVEEHLEAIRFVYHHDEKGLRIYRRRGLWWAYWPSSHDLSILQTSEGWVVAGARKSIFWLRVQLGITDRPRVPQSVAA